LAVNPVGFRARLLIRKDSQGLGDSRVLPFALALQLKFGGIEEFHGGVNSLWFIVYCLWREHCAKTQAQNTLL
jgi:hypothetical protein